MLAKHVGGRVARSIARISCRDRYIHADNKQLTMRDRNHRIDRPTLQDPEAKRVAKCAM